MINKMLVYTDGACRNNGKANACAGIGIYFGPNDGRNVSRRITGKQTNNVAELTAIIEVYSIIKQDILSNKQITIFSDSEYAIRCCTTYGKKCVNRWDIIDIPNKDLVRHAYELYCELPNVKFVHVDAHTGKKDEYSKGNAEADKLATQCLLGDECLGLQQRLLDPVETKGYMKFIPNKVYLNVSYDQKDIAKQLDCRWDQKKKKWYMYEDNKNKSLILNLFS
jgi:ribonuclease HI